MQLSIFQHIFFRIADVKCTQCLQSAAAAHLGKRKPPTKVDGLHSLVAEARNIFCLKYCSAIKNSPNIVMFNHDIVLLNPLICQGDTDTFRLGCQRTRLSLPSPNINVLLHSMELVVFV